jgi:hypothetical protein
MIRRGRRATRKSTLTPDQRIYGLKHENKRLTAELRELRLRVRKEIKMALDRALTTTRLS